MERITKRRPNGQAFLPIKQDHIGPPYEEPNRPAVERLAVIEDILGDDYDLERLLELMNAEQKGRLFITPVKPGDDVYWLLEDDGWYISDPKIVADVGTKGFYTNGVLNLVNLSDNLDFTPWDEIGKTVFLSREAAEAALAKMKEG